MRRKCILVYLVRNHLHPVCNWPRKVCSESLCSMYQSWKAPKLSPAVRQKFWMHHEISATSAKRYWYASLWYTHKILAPTGSACGIVLYYMRAPVFHRVCDYCIHLVVRAISLTLKLLEFLRCDAPVSSTLAWWQRLLTHVSESLRTVSLIQATTSLPILW